MLTDDDIIKEEIDSILEDILAVYYASGKATSYEFEEGLEAVYYPGEGTVRGFVYLNGRKPGKMPPVQNIEEWIKLKGIRAVEEGVSVRSLAWAIAKSIAKKGTNPENHLKVYEQVITPQRIDRIIDRISSLNVNRLITQVSAELEVLAKGV